MTTFGKKPNIEKTNDKLARAYNEKLGRKMPVIPAYEPSQEEINREWLGGEMAAMARRARRDALADIAEAHRQAAQAAFGKRR